jgi:hypothetical protein
MSAEKPTPIQLWVPETFWDDHQDRSPSDDGDAGLCTVLRRSARRVLITGTAKQIDCLRQDAAYSTSPSPARGVVAGIVPMEPHQHRTGVAADRGVTASTRRVSCRSAARQQT